MDEQNKIEEAKSARYCYLCYSVLDDNKACTNPDCPLFGIPQE